MSNLYPELQEIGQEKRGSFSSFFLRKSDSRTEMVMRGAGTESDPMQKQSQALECQKHKQDHHVTAHYTHDTCTLLIQGTALALVTSALKNNF